MVAGLLPIFIYLLCTLAALLCTWLLLRGYLRHRIRLQLWSSVCFGFLSINSLIVILDIAQISEFDLQPFRHMASLAAVGTLLIGLIWEAE